MLGKLRNAVRPSTGGSLAPAFRRLGWIGFWVQVVFGSIPIVLLAYFFTFSGNSSVTRSGVPFVEYLTIANLFLLLFTLFWSHRYTRLARDLADPNRRPTESSVIGTVWTGVTASAIGMIFSMIVLLVEAGGMLFYFLKAPQGGIPVVQTGGVESPHWVSAVDMVSLMALILVLFSELIVLVLSLWLLFRTSLSSSEFPKTVAAVPEGAPAT
jgi:hypothetical protein